jgi:hypothetical protein
LLVIARKPALQSHLLRVQLQCCVIGKFAAMYQLLAHPQRVLPRTLPRLPSSRAFSICLYKHASSKPNTFFPSHPHSSQTHLALQQATYPLSNPRVRSTTAVRAMSSDADYASFLDKANQDTGSAQQQSSSGKKSYGTKSVDTAVPQALEKVEEYYVSDADEPFEPVSLKFDGSSVSAGTHHCCYLISR